MQIARVLLASGLLAMVFVAACVGDDPSDSGSSGSSGGQCTAAQKTCNGNCTSKDDPNAGCASPDCTPCQPATNATSACRAGACSFDCNAGFSDCDGDPKTGCEARTADSATNCGSCGNTCGSANTATAPKCEEGKCVFACHVGFAHCGAKDDSGCDTNLQTSADNCGACGHSCLGGECVSGKCQPFKLVSMAKPTGVATDANHVYISSIQAATVFRVGHDGKCAGGATPCPEEFASQNKGDAFADVRGAAAIVSDGTNVYWVAQAVGTIAMKPVTGGAITKVFGLAKGGWPGMLALGGGKVWWTTSFASADPGPHLYKANLDGTGITVAADYAAPATSNDGIGGLAVDATTVWWATPSFGLYKALQTANKCTEGGTGDCTVGAGGGSSNVYGVAVDDTYVYWTETDGTTANAGSVKRALKTGGMAASVATGQDIPKAIAALGGFVYWANSGTTVPTGASIRRAPSNVAPCAGDACEKVADVTTPTALHAGNDGVYWTDEVSSGGVWRIAK